jgi:hypothetical protein
MVAAAPSIREMRSSLESTSQSYLQRSLDWTDGLASQVTGPHTKWTSSSGVHIKALIYTSPVDSEEDPIARIDQAPTTIR